jgi:hypothetical protein
MKKKDKEIREIEEMINATDDPTEIANGVGEKARELLEEAQGAYDNVFFKVTKVLQMAEARIGSDAEQLLFAFAAARRASDEAYRFSIHTPRSDPGLDALVNLINQIESYGVKNKIEVPEYIQKCMNESSEERKWKRILGATE